MFSKKPNTISSLLLATDELFNNRVCSVCPTCTTSTLRASSSCTCLSVDATCRHTHISTSAASCSAGDMTSLSEPCSASATWKLTAACTRASTVLASARACSSAERADMACCRL